METKESIYFYKTNNKFDYMSNFYSCKFKDINNIIYNCSEQYFMYQKCLLFESNNNKLLEKILVEKNPMLIKKLGRTIKNFDEKKWNEVCYNIMLDGLKLKFGQNKDIMDKLSKTEKKNLYEASKYDKIWGIGFYAENAIYISKDKYGANLLGKCLMEIRNDS